MSRVPKERQARDSGDRQEPQPRRSPRLRGYGAIRHLRELKFLLKMPGDKGRGVLPIGRAAGRALNRRDVRSSWFVWSLMVCSWFPGYLRGQNICERQITVSIVAQSSSQEIWKYLGNPICNRRMAHRMRLDTLKSRENCHRPEVCRQKSQDVIEGTTTSKGRRCFIPHVLLISVRLLSFSEV
jgi:hypothetical protein